MGKLKILPGNIANMIAAGEVVQRPSSVVKELVENSVDAGASSVTVVISDAGRTLIQVIDNGSGMSPSDALLCFERHATSKIAQAEDLENILTYGFRGEALASIAAVADVTLKTRRSSDEVATQVQMSGGKAVTSQVSAPVGTSIAVRNLFYNTPARRKFLKSDNVEFKHIMEEFVRVALTRPELAFTLTHNGRDIYVLKAAKSLKFRILDIMGSSVADEIVDVHAETSVVRVDGFVGRPDRSKKSQGNQFFFINGRYFRSAYLHKAVMKAYEGFIPEGVAPAYFLYLEADPHSLDVNIHPTKTEIKFEDETVVFQIVFACVKETLGKHSFGTTIDFEAASDVQMPSFGRSVDAYKPMSVPMADFDPDFNPFEPQGPSGEGFVGGLGRDGVPAGTGYQGGDGHFNSRGGAPGEGWRPSGAVTPDQDYGRLFEQERLPSTKALVLQGKYILSPVEGGVMVVSIRRAYERVLYERFLGSLSGGTPVTQSALFPVQVVVGVQERMALEQAAPQLGQLGFEIAPSGRDTVVVSGVPEGYSREEGGVQQMIDNLLLILSDDSSSIKEAMVQSRAQKLAILGASSRPALTSPLEAQNLLERLLSCETPETTPTGHRILSVISFAELDKKLQ
mgnify:CR=1 FL=1